MKKTNVRDKKMAKFYIHAYQSWIFNEMMDEYARRNRKPTYSKAPIIGYETKIRNDAFGRILKKTLKKEKISQKSFELGNMKCVGGERPAFVEVGKVDYEINRNDVKLSFFLPKGSYGTVLLEQIGL